VVISTIQKKKRIIDLKIILAEDCVMDLQFNSLMKQTIEPSLMDIEIVVMKMNHVLEFA
jgi:hypothetical protein